MSEKTRRQAAILDLVRERRVSTQDELAAALREAGHQVVQTTVSRDIHELGLVKVRTADGKLAYAPPSSHDAGRLRRLGPALRRWALSAESSGTIVVLQTPRGYAAPLADAIDEASHPAILGTVAGENTIIVVAAEGVPGEALRDELRSHLLEGAA
jgi:transcriptional regulator of arginine metabolism